MHITLTGYLMVERKENEKWKRSSNGNTSH